MLANPANALFDPRAALGHGPAKYVHGDERIVDAASRGRREAVLLGEVDAGLGQRERRLEIVVAHRRALRYHAVRLGPRIAEAAREDDRAVGDLGGFVVRPIGHAQAREMRGRARELDTLLPLEDLDGFARQTGSLFALALQPAVAAREAQHARLTPAVGSLAVRVRGLDRGLVGERDIEEVVGLGQLLEHRGQVRVGYPDLERPLVMDDALARRIGTQ